MRLVFDKRYHDALASGAKQCSIRQGDKSGNLCEGEILDIECPAGEVLFEAVVILVLVDQLRDIPLACLRADGFSSHREAVDRLRVFYPDLTLSSVVTYIEWLHPEACR